jgi:hypothetical protein
MHRGPLLFAAFFALALSDPTAARAAPQTVWSGLVIAENVPEPTPIPPELAQIEQTLKDLFGYNQFQVIGQSRNTLKTGDEDWLASSKYFALHVDARGDSEAGYLLNLRLYKEKELLLDWDTQLSKKSPLVIKGPQVGSGQLVLVLLLENSDPQNTSHHKHKADAHSNEIITAWRHFTHLIRDSLP